MAGWASRAALGTACAVLALACAEAGTGTKVAAVPSPTLELRVRSSETTSTVHEAPLGAATSELRPIWRFRTGSPIAAAPTVGADGRIYVATSEGYLHALGPDGQYLWSYTLLGAASGAPAFGPHGGAYVGTTAGRLYAIRGDGTKSWIFRLPSPILSDLVADEQGKVYFCDGDRHLYALAPNGVAIWRENLAGFATAGPVLTSIDVVTATTSGELVAVGPRRRTRRLPLPGPVSAPPLLAPDGRVYVIAADSLVAVGSDRTELWRFSGVHAAAVDKNRLVVVTPPDKLVWLSDQGKPERELALGHPLGDALAVDGSHTAYAALDGGGLIAISLEGALRSVPSTAPVRYLAYDEERARILATTNTELLAFVASSR